MEDKKEVKSFAEIERENEEKLNQFMFIIFYSNPNTKTIKYGVDGDKMESTMSRDKFLSIIEETCGYIERNKIENVCYEYGIPYVYDRIKKHLYEMPEMPPERHIEVTPNYHKEFENSGKGLLDKDGLFNESTSVFEKYSGIGLPNFNIKK